MSAVAPSRGAHSAYPATPAQARLDATHPDNAPWSARLRRRREGPGLGLARRSLPAPDGPPLRAGDAYGFPRPFPLRDLSGGEGRVVGNAIVATSPSLGDELSRTLS